MPSKSRNGNPNPLWVLPLKSISPREAQNFRSHALAAEAFENEGILLAVQGAGKIGVKQVGAHAVGHVIVAAAAHLQFIRGVHAFGGGRKAIVSGDGIGGLLGGLFLLLLLFGRGRRSAAAAFGLEWLLYNWLLDRLAEADTLQLFSFVPFEELLIPMVSVFAAAGLFVGIVGSWTSIRKFMDV